jgi:glutathionyl-hydroquinone reductase
MSIVYGLKSGDGGFKRAASQFRNWVTPECRIRSTTPSS